MKSVASNTTSTPPQNPSSETLVNKALQRKEGVLASNKALVVATGKRTGRSPKDRFIVRDPTTDWQLIGAVLTRQLPRKFLKPYGKKPSNI